VLHQSVLLSNRSCILAACAVYTRVVTLVVKLSHKVSEQIHRSQVVVSTDLQILPSFDCFLEHFERVFSIHGRSEKFRFDRIDFIAQVRSKSRVDRLQITGLIQISSRSGSRLVMCGIVRIIFDFNRLVQQIQRFCNIELCFQCFIPSIAP
jgi:hypothetical protein